jgi:DNA excision repair protein ERCC-6
MQCAGTGTLRINRLKNIKMINKKDMNKKARGFYESHVDQHNELILIKWKDNKVVSLLSNAFGLHPLTTARRYVHSERKKTDIPQPQVVAQYNKFMGGVDLLDRHIANYRMSIRGKKFYMPIVLWMLDLAITNAWSLAKSCNCKMDQLEFRRRLARGLLISHGKVQTKGKSTKPPEYLSKGVHTSVKAESRLRCKQCHLHTQYRCDTCNIALHTKCSSSFHKLLK